MVCVDFFMTSSTVNNFFWFLLRVHIKEYMAGFLFLLFNMYKIDSHVSECLHVLYFQLDGSET